MNNSITVRDAHPLTVNAPETVLTVFADALVDRLSEAGVVTTR